jgi:hypothetical protein
MKRSDEVWNSIFAVHGWETPIDENVPSQIAQQLVLPSDQAAALDIWRGRMIADVEHIVRRYKDNGGQ